MKQSSSVVLKYILSVALIGLVQSCAQDKAPVSIESLLEMESAQGYEGQAVPDARIAELQEAIDKYGAIVREKVDAANQLGVYYKMLGQAYLDQRVYRLSLEAFENAISVHPDNAVLYYRAGLSAAQYAQSRVDPMDVENYISKAAAYYRRGIEFDPSNSELLYALSVLYVFDLEQSESAIPLLNRLLGREPTNVSALFLLGRANAELGRATAAVDAYERAAEAATDPAVRTQALQNASQLLDSGRG